MDVATGDAQRFVLHHGLQDDDHNSAALLVRPDGRYLAMYGAHLADSLSRWRVSAAPGDATAWTDERTIDNGAAMTYSNLHYLPGDVGGPGRAYNFVRSIGFDPNILVSDDQGSTWSYGGRLLAEGDSGDRPYVRYASDGERIHFIATERHPRDYDNSVYHSYVQDGALYDSAGAVVDADVLDPAAAAPNQLTRVLATGTIFGGEVMRRAWTVDLEVDAGGSPVAVFQARAGDDEPDHRFFYARREDDAWRVNPLAYAGSYLYAAEKDYTGLVAIDPYEPSTVYVSTEVHPATQTQLIGSDGRRHYELFRGRTSDGGDTWRWTPLTFNSAQDNLRPVVPAWNDENSALLWMRGDYSSYRDYDTQIFGVINPNVEDAQRALAVDIGRTGQEAAAGYDAFTRAQTPGGGTETQTFASPFGADNGEIVVTLSGVLEFHDRGDDVAGPVGAVQDDFVVGDGGLSLTLGNLAEGDYQLVLYAHDRDADRPAYDIRGGRRTLGAARPTQGAAPEIGTASSRVAFYAGGVGEVDFRLEAPSGGVVLNGFEVWAGAAYQAPPPVDLNGDGDLDLTDYFQYVGGLHADMSGLTALEAYRHGDRNGDLRNDFADFRLFRSAYDQWNGAGALADALAAAPEPASGALAAWGAAVGAAGRRRDAAPLGTQLSRESDLPQQPIQAQK